jgi:hypothetical protein
LSQFLKYFFPLCEGYDKKEEGRFFQGWEGEARMKIPLIIHWHGY